MTLSLYAFCTVLMFMVLVLWAAAEGAATKNEAGLTLGEVAGYSFLLALFWPATMLVLIACIFTRFAFWIMGWPS